MKNSLIWMAVGAGVIGIGVPAYAAVQTSKPLPSITTVKTTVEDIRGNCDEAEHANDPTCATMVVPAAEATTPVTQPSTTVDDSTTNSIDDDRRDATVNSIDDNGNDATVNSVEDVSGPCDEAEHATDPRCTGAAAPVDSVDDNSGPGSDNSGPGSDNSSHGGSDD